MAGCRQWVPSVGAVSGCCGWMLLPMHSALSRKAATALHASELCRGVTALNLPAHPAPPRPGRRWSASAATSSALRAASCSTPPPPATCCSTGSSACGTGRRPPPGSTPIPSPAPSAASPWRRTAGGCLGVEWGVWVLGASGGMRAGQDSKSTAGCVSGQGRHGLCRSSLGLPPSLPTQPSLRRRVHPCPRPPAPQLQPGAVPLRPGLLLAVRPGHGAGAHVDQHRGALLRGIQGGGGGASQRGAAVRKPAPSCRAWKWLVWCSRRAARDPQKSHAMRCLQPALARLAVLALACTARFAAPFRCILNT